MNERAAIAYSRHTIFAGEPPTWDAALAGLSALPAVVAVNVRTEESADPVAISEESLRQILATSAGYFLVDAVPMTAFLDVVRAKIGDLGVEAERFRATLRSEYIEETTGAWHSIVRHLDQTLFLLRGFVLQRPSPRLEGATATLARARDGLLLAVDAHDNCGAMDGVRYEIVPSLDEILGALGRPV
jgi:hypothetical protein